MPTGTTRVFFFGAMQPTDAFIRRAKIVRVIDGDTLVVDVDLGFSTWKQEIVRLAGVDAPEARGPEAAAGKWVTQQLVDWIGDVRECWIHSETYAVDKYQRCVAQVWVGGHCTNSWLLQKGYAWPTDSDGKALGLQSVEALAIPDAVKQQVREAMT